MRDDRKKTILCYGDSNTFGYMPAGGFRYPKERRWTEVLASKLGSDYEVISEGVNGRTTAFDRTVDRDWLNGLDAIAATVAAHLPLDYIVIMLGTNDCVSELSLEPAAIAQGMRQVALKALEVTSKYQDSYPDVNTQIVIVSPPAIRPDFLDKCQLSADDMDEESVMRSQAISPLYKSLASDLGFLYVDAGSAEVSEIDCIHLTEAGHRQLGELVYETIEK